MVLFATPETPLLALANCWPARFGQSIGQQAALWPSPGLLHACAWDDYLLLTTPLSRKTGLCFGTSRCVHRLRTCFLCVRLTVFPFPFRGLCVSGAASFLHYGLASSDAAARALLLRRPLCRGCGRCCGHFCPVFFCVGLEHLHLALQLCPLRALSWSRRNLCPCLCHQPPATLALESLTCVPEPFCTCGRNAACPPSHCARITDFLALWCSAPQCADFCQGRAPPRASRRLSWASLSFARCAAARVAARRTQALQRCVPSCRAQALKSAHAFGSLQTAQRQVPFPFTAHALQTRRSACRDTNKHH